jgi:hypothetical protein
MNPLKRVRLDWETISIGHNPAEAMELRPALAVKVSQCIGTSALVELWLGLTLAHLMKADHRAALAMFNSVQSRSAQAGMLRAAAEEALSSQPEKDLFECILSAGILPAFKERDKLAHWIWGYSLQLPHDLLLMEPIENQDFHVQMFIEAKFDPCRDNVYVVTEQYLASVVEKLKRALSFAGRTVALLRMHDPERAQQYLRLSSEPEIQAALVRLNERRMAPVAR